MNPYKALEEYRERERQGTLPVSDPDLDVLFAELCSNNEIEQRVAKIEAAAGRPLTEDERDRIRFALADGGITDADLLKLI